MISPFRKSRKANMPTIDSKKSNNYFLYAFGEIILVVAGILIALSINNWNEGNKNTKHETQYLINLKANLLADYIALQSLIDSTKVQITHVTMVQDMLVNPKEYTKSSYDNISTYVFQVQNFTSVKSTFDNLNSSGNLGLIKNQVLVDDLFTYYQEIEEYNSGIEKATMSYSRDHITPYFMKFDVLNFENEIKVRYNYDLIKSKSISDYAKDVFIINAVGFKRILLNLQLENFHRLLNLNKKINAIIDQEL
jgi:uncharacterized protein DUF6090